MLDDEDKAFIMQVMAKMAEGIQSHISDQFANIQDEIGDQTRVIEELTNEVKTIAVDLARLNLANKVIEQKIAKRG